jgi:hypothetical protein
MSPQLVWGDMPGNAKHLLSMSVMKIEARASRLLTPFSERFLKFQTAVIEGGKMMRKKLLVLLMVLAVSFPSALAFGQITGFISTSSNEQKAYLDLDIGSTSIYEVDLDIPIGSKLTSVRMSGEVVGEGKANAFIEDDRGSWFVVLSYNNIRNPFSKAVTGLFDGMSKTLAGENPNTLYFEDKCVETCFVEGSFKSGKAHLIFDIGEGTRLKINEISYRYEIFPSPISRFSFKLG